MAKDGALSAVPQRIIDNVRAFASDIAAVICAGSGISISRALAPRQLTLCSRGDARQSVAPRDSMSDVSA